MKIVHKQTDNGTIKEIIQEQNHFFARVTEPNGEVTESQDFNTLERAKESIGIKPTITENNKLLAEFMNHKPTFEVFIDDVLTTMNRPIKNYNSDWNDLMECVEKIYKTDLYYDKYIDYNSSMFSSGKIRLSTNIESVYNDCIEFVKWYNENTGQEK